MLRLFRRRRRRKSPPSFEPMNLSTSNKTSVFFFSFPSFLYNRSPIYMCVWVNTGTLYSLTIPAEKKNCCTPAMFFFFLLFPFRRIRLIFIAFYFICSGLPPPPPNCSTPRAISCVHCGKKKYVGRAAMGTVFIFKPCPASNIYYASKAHKCKNNLSFFSPLWQLQ